MVLSKHALHRTKPPAQAVDDMLQVKPAAQQRPGAGGCAQCAPPQSSLAPLPAAKTYLALDAAVRRHGLRSLSVRCFDIVTDADTTGRTLSFILGVGRMA